MKDLGLSSEKLSQVVYKKLFWAFGVIAYIGLMDAIYLTAEHYSGTGLNCVIFTGCDEVANSESSTMFGFPVALYGVIYYFGILLISFLHLNFADKKFKGIFKLLNSEILPFYTLIGLAMSLRFLYLQVFVINALCTYCLISLLTSTLLFILGIILWRKTNRG